MIQLRGLSLAVIIISALVARPAAAQHRNASSSLTHVVSVTVPARVKVKVSSIALMPSRSIPSAVKVAPAQNGLALTVDANKAWVLTVSGDAGSHQWTGTQSGEFTALAKADSARPAVLTVSAP